MGEQEVRDGVIGRPKGSQNRPVVFLSETPENCPACLSTDRKTLRRLPDQNYSGTTKQGSIYNVIERRRVICQSCGQVAIVRKYVFNKFAG